jgi:hypothetical protein
MPRPRPSVQKPCPRCHTVKPLELFYSSPNYDGGYSTYCRECIRDLNRQGRNPERCRVYMRERYAENREHLCAVSRANVARSKRSDPAKHRAKKFFDVNRAGVAPDITRLYLAELFRTVKDCQCCGRPLSLEYQERETREYRSNPDSPSVDRVNNAKGYSKGNIAIICWRCNFRKTDLTLEDLAMFESYIRRFGDV